MTQPFVTSWTGGGPCTTPYETGQTAAQWFDNHETRTRAQLELAPPGDGGPITTTWKSGGAQKSVVTHKLEGETTNEWIDRHFKRVREELEGNPPDLT